MCKMIRLRETLGAVRKAMAVRPALVVGAVAIIWSLFYRSVIYSDKTPNYMAKETVTLKGTVADKKLDEAGNLRTIYIKANPGFLCYVNNPSALQETVDYYKRPVRDINAVLPKSGISIGSEVIITGKYGNFNSATNPGEFDSKRYYNNRGYWHYVNLESLEIVSEPAVPIREALFNLRHRLCDIVDANCPLEGGTINTLLFGEKADLDEDRQDLYRASGLSHFLVISGLHIFVAGGGIYSLFKKTGMRRSIAATVSIAFILFYGGLVGFGISVFRAVFMFFLRLLADILNKTYDILSALFLAMSVSILINPLCVRDSAFLYSYGAVFITGLFYTYLRKDMLVHLYSHLYVRGGAREKLARIKLNAVVPVLIYFFLLPLTLYFQAYSNLLSVILNLFMGLITTPILLCSALGFFAGALHISFLAGLFDFLCALLLKLIDGISRLAALGRPFNIVYKPEVWQVVLFYIILLTILFKWQKKLPGFMNIILIISSVLFLGQKIYQPLEVYITDVGQGDCIVVRTGKNSAIVSDCGSSSKKNVGKYVLIPFLKAKGITRIEDLYISHGDSDHTNGIVELLENCEMNGIYVNRILFPILPEDCYGSALGEIAGKALERGILVDYIRQGAKISYGPRSTVSVTCLWPGEKVFGDTNKDSLVLWVNIGKFDMLLTGDATVETEELVINYLSGYRGYQMPVITEDCRIEVLKCGHHGSSTSSGREFLEYIKPLSAVISVGRNNSYGHPHEETLDSLYWIGAKVFRTDECGQITIKVN